MNVHNTIQPYVEGSCQMGRVGIAKVGYGCLRSVNEGGPAAAERAEYYDVIIPCEGPISFCQNDMSGVVNADEYVVLSGNAFYELSSRDSLVHWRVTIPASDLRSRLSSIDDHLGKRFDQNRPMAGLMHGMIGMIARTFTEETPPNPEALATEVIAFVALVLASEVGKVRASARNSRYRLKQRIFDFVDEHLADSELSPSRIAKANRISVSYLYSLFSDNRTTVAQFIQAKRLQRAYELLVADPNGALTVSEIAYLVGFKNVSHFSRTFSQHFQMAPRDARQSGLQRRTPEKPRQKAVEPAYEPA